MTTFSCAAAIEARAATASTERAIIALRILFVFRNMMILLVVRI
jgi:hypothetical protein